jgi:hypothetical protein
MKKDDDYIPAHSMQPGMVIAISRTRKYDDICLVIATNGFVEVSYTHLDFQDSYGGPLIGTIDGKEIIKVIRGNRRNFVIKKIKEDVFRNHRDIENTIDIIKLIEAMS